MKHCFYFVQPGSFSSIKLLGGFCSFFFFWGYTNYPIQLTSLCYFETIWNKWVGAKHSMLFDIGLIQLSEKPIKPVVQRLFPSFFTIWDSEVIIFQSRKPFHICLSLFFQFLLATQSKLILISIPFTAP